MKSVSNIFGEAKIKILRLFIFNPTLSFRSSEVATRAKEKPQVARREIQILVKEGLLKSRARGYILDPSYPYLAALENLLIDATPITWKEIVEKINRVGAVKLVLVSGVFLHDRDSRVDLLVVGEHLSQAKLSTAVSTIEAELGKELRYAVFETADFKYRLGIYDKLIKDIFDSHHEKILNKMGI